MKPKTLLTLTFGFLLALVCGNLSAQNAATTGNATPATNAQAVAAEAVNNPDVIVISGKILDAQTKQPIKNTKINFSKFGDELLRASLDENGNYSLALNKKEIGEPVRVVFKISGYKRYVIKKVDKNSNYLQADIFLEPTQSEDKSQANVKYVMSDDPFNTMVIKMNQ